MGRAREEMHEEEARVYTRKILLYMVVLNRLHPDMDISALETTAEDAMQSNEDDEELERKLSKDD